jgi:hypothetical protein
MDMREVNALHGRLSAVGGVADMLAASWDTFELVQTIADDYAEQAPDMFAAFMFAAAAAANGMDAVGFAPSMPASPGEAAPRAGAGRHDAGEIADELASLMTALTRCLETGASQANDPGDRQACEQAAREADRIRGLLSPDRP